MTVFAIVNNMNIESATQLLLKLGMCSYKKGSQRSNMGQNSKAVAEEKRRA